MRFLKKSIVAKLWLAIVILVLIITWVTGMVQSNIIKKVYYQQQTDSILRQGNEIAGALSNEENAREKISLISEMTDTNIMLVNRDGYIQECHGMGMNMSSTKISILDHHGDLITMEDLKKVLAGERVIKSGINEIIGAKVLSAMVPVTNGGRTTGAVIVSSSIAAIEGQISEYQKIILNVGIGGIILATFLSLLFSRSLSRPLVQMNKVARALARGDFSRKVAVKSEDEIGVLANSLNTLSGDLQEKITALERLDQTRKDFVAGISHELRTPLTIIQGYAEALKDNVAESEEERRDCIDGIVEETGRLRRLVFDLLDLRRIESGQENIELSEFDISPVLLKAAEKMGVFIEQKGIALDLDIPENIPPVLANPDRLQQILFNLLENAVRYTPTGGSVRVNTVVFNGFVKVSVKDSGPGIPEGEQELIWEKFYKVDKSRTRREGGGTGLGLAIVKRLVEKMDGQVYVESTPGQGTTFSFTLKTGVNPK
ncbi:MAG: cell wall metabolism sensor histidine kinase WalK [Actinobacteria bacterium]|nr:cell wall metabolism sensor histidine kinase WalK [Actinomycetota bacterium]